MVLNEEKGEVLVVQDRQLVYAHFSTLLYIYELKITLRYCIYAKKALALNNKISSSQMMNIYVEFHIFEL